jgi:hypothetical protein
MSNSLKFGWKEYWKPTPLKIRKLADALVAATTFSGSVVNLEGDSHIGTAIIVIGFLSKTVSNFFTENENRII